MGGVKGLEGGHREKRRLVSWREGGGLRKQQQAPWCRRERVMRGKGSY